MTMPTYSLITGGAGFIGCNLADALLHEGETVIVADNFSRDGAYANAQWLEGRHRNRVQIAEVDVRDRNRLAPLVMGARTVYHLAAQVAVTASLEDPRTDLETNLLGTFNVLDAARTAREPPAILFTSSNKVYGTLEHLPIDRCDRGYRFADAREGIDETAPLDFHSPYSCSKGAADQYVRDFSRIYGLPTVVLRMSCVYGPHQAGTEDQGWVAHFARMLLRRRPVSIYGDGYQVRDLLWIGDLVRALRAASERATSIAGRIFNIGGGPTNAVSVRTVINRLVQAIGYEAPVVLAEWRKGDQRVYVSGLARAARELDWRPEVGWEDGLERLVAWLRQYDIAEGCRTRDRSTRAIPLRPAG